jgi:hypothetical protein
VVPVRVAGQHAVDGRGPVVEARGELAAEGLGSPEGGRGDLGEHGKRGAAAEGGDRRPFRHAPARGAAPPLQAPGPRPLDAPGVRARAYEVVAHAGAREPLLAVDFDRGDQELRDGDLAEAVHEAAHLPRERAGVQD